jgi:hypothetical protein
MQDIIDAHKFSSNHQKQLTEDEICGCFYCLKIYHPREINHWVKDTDGTALCPHCGIDAVIGQSSGYPITPEFLKQMKAYWF